MPELYTHPGKSSAIQTELHLFWLYIIVFSYIADIAFFHT